MTTYPPIFVTKEKIPDFSAQRRWAENFSSFGDLKNTAAGISLDYRGFSRAELAVVPPAAFDLLDVMQMDLDGTIPTPFGLPKFRPAGFIVCNIIHQFCLDAVFVAPDFQLAVVTIDERPTGTTSGRVVHQDPFDVINLDLGWFCWWRASRNTQANQQ